MSIAIDLAASVAFCDKFPDGPEGYLTIPGPPCDTIEDAEDWISRVGDEGTTCFVLEIPPEMIVIHKGVLLEGLTGVAVSLTEGDWETGVVVPLGGKFVPIMNVMLEADWEAIEVAKTEAAEVAAAKAGVDYDRDIRNER